jgi:hypothetical protein
MTDSRDTGPAADESLSLDPTPKRRVAGLSIVEVDGETVAYDLRSHHAHRLNPTMAFVWQQCDGSRSAADIAAALERQHGVPAGSGAVWSALEQLGDAGLLEQPAEHAGVTLSRRLVLRPRRPRPAGLAPR